MEILRAWAYYSFGHVPPEIVNRFFTGAYDEESCKRIARQFVEIDHHNGPDDKISGWVGDDAFSAFDRRAWRLFYFYLFAWHYSCFSKAMVTLGGKSASVELFNADGKWYAKEGYEIFGADVGAYKGSEIEFAK